MTKPAGCEFQLDYVRTDHPTRRQLIQTAGAILIGAAAEYTVGNIQADFFMNHEPRAYVWSRPNSRATLIVAPGAGNSGLRIGRLLNYALGDRTSVVAIEYAETNVDADKIVKVTKNALSIIAPRQRQKIGHYWLSAGGAIMVPAVHELGEQADLVLLDSVPQTRADLRGRNGVAASLPESMSRDRFLNLLFCLNKSNSIAPAARDKADWVPLDLAEDYRTFTVNADLITSAAEVKALDRPVPPNALGGFAATAFYMTCPAGPGEQQSKPGIDPLVITETAHPHWNIVFGGNVQLYVDPHRSANSHGVGPIYPGGIMHQVEQFLA